MKNSAVIALALSLTLHSTSSFAPSAATIRPRSMARMAETEAKEAPEAMDLNLEEMQEMFEEADKSFAGKVRESEAIPWSPRPVGLDAAKLAGDRGFDPLGFAKDRATLIKYREAEIKHSRLAMLAAAGWPLAEAWDKSIAKTLGLSSPIAENGGLSPSVLNGGLGKISPAYWLVVVGAAAAIEVIGLQQKGSRNTATEYLPGDYGFDPLGVYPKDGAGQAQMQESELRHGRTAMVAIVAFAAQEFTSKVPVVREWPFFFEPIWTFVKEIGFFDLSRGFYEIPVN